MMRVTPEQLHRLLGQVDDCAVECDGSVRLMATLLEAAGVPYTVKSGSVALPNGKTMTPHFWLVVGEYIADYRARMWLGDQAPHGVFSPDAVEATYDGDPVTLKVPSSLLFHVLAGQPLGTYNTTLS